MSPAGVAPHGAAVPAPSDEVLMAQVQQGDRTAYQLLVRRHGRGLQRFAQRLLQQPDDADDVAQETLLRVWQHAAQWQLDRVRFSSWLYRIAHNLCMDRLRQALRQRTDSMDSSAMDQLSEEARGGTSGPHESSGLSAPAQQVSNAALAKRLDLAIGALPERQRAALIMCFHQGFTSQQAADVLSVSVDALESLLARGRRTLRLQLADWRPGASE